jgi:hypothetical protein
MKSKQSSLPNKLTRARLVLSAGLASTYIGDRDMHHSSFTARINQVADPQLCGGSSRNWLK